MFIQKISFATDDLDVVLALAADWAADATNERDGAAHEDRRGR